MLRVIYFSKIKATLGLLESVQKNNICRTTHISSQRDLRVLLEHCINRKITIHWSCFQFSAYILMAGKCYVFDVGIRVRTPGRMHHCGRFYFFVLNEYRPSELARIKQMICQREKHISLANCLTVIFPRRRQGRASASQRRAKCLCGL